MQLFKDKYSKYYLKLIRVNTIVTLDKHQFIEDCIFTVDSFKNKKTFLEGLKTNLQLSKSEKKNLKKISCCINTNREINPNHWFIESMGKFYKGDI